MLSARENVELPLLLTDLDEGRAPRARRDGAARRRARGARRPLPAHALGRRAAARRDRARDRHRPRAHRRRRADRRPRREERRGDPRAAAHAEAGVRQDRRDGDARPARASATSTRSTTSTRACCSRRAAAAAIGARDGVDDRSSCPLVWQEPRAQQAAHRCSPAARSRSRSRWCACCARCRPASTRILERPREEHPHLGAQQGRHRLPACPTPTSQKVRDGAGRGRGDELDLVRRRLRGGEGRHVPELRGRARARSASVFEDSSIDPQAARRLPALPRRRDRRAADDARSTAGRSATCVTLKSTVFPVDLDFRIVGDDPATSASRASGSSASTSTRRCEAAGVARSTRSARSGRASTTRRASTRSCARSTRCSATARPRPRPRPRRASSRTSSARSQGFVTIILIVTGLVALCIVFIAANTASMAVRERVGEIAVLKAIGFRWRLLFGTLRRRGGAARDARPARSARSLVARLSRRSLAARRGLEPARSARSAASSSPTRSSCRASSSRSSSACSRASCPSCGAARRSVAATLREVF